MHTVNQLQIKKKFLLIQASGKEISYTQSKWKCVDTAIVQVYWAMRTPGVGNLWISSTNVAPFLLFSYSMSLEYNEERW